MSGDVSQPAGSRTASSRRFGVWTITVAAVIAAAISNAPLSLALWNGAATADAGTINAGTINAAVAPGTATPTTATTAALGSFTGLIPGESRSATFTVRNTGNVDLVFSAAVASGVSAHLAFGVAAGACPASPPAGTALSATAAGIGTVVAPATNATFCLRVTLSDTAPASLQNTSVGGFTIDLTAASSA